MPNIKSSKKSMKKDEKRRLNNRRRISEMKTYKKTFTSLCSKQVDADNLSSIESSFRKAQSLFARAARKNLIHRNKAARNISKMMKIMDNTRASIA